MSQLIEDDELMTRREGPIARIVLNRPPALNALSLEMIRILSYNLSVIEKDENVKAVFIEGGGDRAFCAGGDIKAAYLAGMGFRRGHADERVLSVFFGEEYRMNRQLFHFGKPVFAFMRGIVMGGGFGVAGPCQYRIATDSTRFAMPEVGIGLFPDVGSTYFLNRCPGQAGAYLAVTGNAVGAADMRYCGLANHYVREEQWEMFRMAMAEAKDFAALLEEYDERPLERSAIEEKRETIDACFAFDSVEEIIGALKGCGDEWAAQQAQIIESRSPISLKVSLAHLRKSKGQNFDTITARDYLLVQHFMRGHDFYEGVRAMVIDKDRRPQWEPADLENISDTDVMAYFEETGQVLDDIAA